MAKVQPLHTEARLQQTIQQQLAKCDEVTAPELCRRISTPEGYLQVEEAIIIMMMRQSLTPAAAIELLKSEWE